jgi:hypothetical protein
MKVYQKIIQITIWWDKKTFSIKTRISLETSRGSVVKRKKRRASHLVSDLTTIMITSERPSHKKESKR